MKRSRKRVRHFHERGQLHEFTFSCYHRRPLDQRLFGAVDCPAPWGGANSTWRWELVAFVFMPEPSYGDGAACGGECGW